MVKVHAGRTTLVLGDGTPGATVWAVQDLTNPLRTCVREVACELRIDAPGVLAWHEPIERNVVVPEAATDVLVSALTRMELDETPEALHLHAGAVRVGDRGMLIAGPREAGKTSLVFSLVNSGAGYLTDEMVSVGGDLALTGYPKPLTLKGDSQEWVDLPLEVSPSGRAALPAGAIGNVIRTTGCDLVVFPRFDPTTDSCQVELLHPLDALHALVAETFDLQRFGANALHILGRLVLAAVPVRLTYSDRCEAARVLSDFDASSTFQHSAEFSESGFAVRVDFDDGYGVELDRRCRNLRTISNKVGVPAS